MSSPANHLSKQKRLPRALLSWALIAILWLATGLRFYQLDAQSFWNDEGNSARLSERSLALIVEGTASDVHPPLYYILLHGWRAFLGDTEFGLRSFSAFTGVLTVAATLALARLLMRAPGRTYAELFPLMMTGMLAAFSPPLVYYSQETRMYALLALIGVLSTLVLLRFLAGTRRRMWALLYLLLITAGLYTHYFFPIMLVVHAIILSLWWLRQQVTLAFAPLSLVNRPARRQTVMIWLAMVLAGALLYAPWLPIFLRQTSGRAATRPSIVRYLWDSFHWLSFGETVTQDEMVLATLVVVLLLAWGIVTRGRRVLILAIAVLVPVVAMYLAGTTSPAFFKFQLVAVPFLLVWMAASAGLNDQAMPEWPVDPRVVTGPITAAIVLTMLISLNNLFHDPDYARADYRAMAARIAADGHPRAAVVLNAPNQWEVFTYYHQEEEVPVYPMPKGQPDPALIEPRLAQIAAQHDRIYALYWGDEQRDPQSVVEQWLDTNAFVAEESWVGDVRFVIYAVPSAAESRAQTPLSVVFGENIRLEGYSMAGRRARPGEILQTTLFWTAQDAPLERYKVFLHLIDGAGNLVAQRDQEPVGGMRPTVDWQAGESVTDNQGLLLPLDLPAGEYRLLLGLYAIGAPSDRLTTDQGEDTLLLGTIIVEEPRQ